MRSRLCCPSCAFVASPRQFIWPHRERPRERWGHMRCPTCGFTAHTGEFVEAIKRYRASRERQVSLIEGDDHALANFNRIEAYLLADPGRTVLLADFEQGCELSHGQAIVLVNKLTAPDGPWWPRIRWDRPRYCVAIQSIPADAPRCAGYCGGWLYGGVNFFTVVEPSRDVRHFCDSDCMTTYYREQTEAFAADVARETREAMIAEGTWDAAMAALRARQESGQ